MRVTNSMLISSTLENINKNALRLEKNSQLVSSGRRLSKPADDPVAVARALQLRADLRAVGQYRRNVDAARAWMRASEVALRGSTDIIQRARELAVMGASGSLSPLQRAQIAAEVQQLFESVLELANAKHGGQYLFAGFKVGTPPFAAAGNPQGFNYLGDAGVVERELDANAKIAVNVDGVVAFGPILTAIKKLKDALDISDIAQINISIGDLDTALNGVLSMLATNGAKTSRVEMTDERLLDVRLGIQRELSNTEDVDMAEALLEQTVAANVYQASLMVGTQVIQPSLLDYLT